METPLTEMTHRLLGHRLTSRCIAAYPRRVADPKIHLKKTRQLPRETITQYF
jgi:hypothetical protein